ncbi:DNA-binding protein H-NS [Pseudidiomarina indica]|uniref:DNA-binding protein n=1 Tax=Pseudidiomarina indica TaxID=1159017 RepID=A0A1G6AGT2_9GAMM|nr:H-NS family nucleoid-associated regulatory protein [Pseudidiomarina indica]SDB07579.1 DNA-binding protein H-NS [Pseudidiomarina indica]
MSDTLKILLHERRLKAAVKGLTIAELEAVKEKLERIIDDRREEEAEMLKMEEEKLRKVEEVKRLMDELGVGLTELVGEDVTPAVASTTRKRAPKPPKYAIIDAHGERITWTGQGRMPNALKAAIESGKSLEDFLIK